MKVIETALSDVVLFEPRVFHDARGFFFESFNEQSFRKLTDTDLSFVQDNHSGSSRNVLRGLHYQVRQPQGKLVRVVAGEVFDVAVDLRRSSPTFGKSAGYILSAENRRMLWIPPGFAHGFFALGEWNEVLYKTTDYYAPEHERALLWNDPDVRIAWPEGEPIISDKDQKGTLLGSSEVYG